jgi:cobalt/nickel transport system ATP-binding protein
MNALVEVVDLTYRYPDGTPALAGVSFAVQEGDRVAILGPIGAGKSTLLLHLNGLLLPQSGNVVVAGIRVTRQTCKEVRKSIGLVFQDPDDQLFLPTLLEDVAFGPLNEGRAPAEAERHAKTVLRDLGLAGSEGRAAHHLSGGQKRLAALATVLVSRPRVLVLDEPTGNLDAEGRAKVARLLRQRQETLVVATHDLEVARAVCGRCIVLDQGRVAAAGSASEMLADNALLERHRLHVPLDDVTQPDATRPRI